MPYATTCTALRRSKVLLVKAMLADVNKLIMQTLHGYVVAVLIGMFHVSSCVHIIFSVGLPVLFAVCLGAHIECLVCSVASTVLSLPKPSRSSLPPRKGSENIILLCSIDAEGRRIFFFLLSLSPKCCAVQAISEVCAVCNDARIEFKDGRFHAVGAPTEAALVVLVEKLGVSDAGLKARIVEKRRADPQQHADATCQTYCRR